MSQFVTHDDAKAIALQLATIGGGVLPEHPDQSVSGIYIPDYGPFPTPSQGEAKFYHFRFRNGASGLNAGLVKGIMQTFPTRWPLMIAIDATV